MKKTSLDPIIIGGFAGSGSSAVVDLLKEVEGTVDPNVEWRFVTDPDGILSLDSVLNNIWTPYQSDIALKRFSDLITALSKKYNSPYCGYNMNDILSPEFEKVSRELVRSLEDVSFQGMWTGISDRKYRAFHKINRILGLKLHAFEKKVAVMRPTPFSENLLKNYLRDVINLISSPEGKSRIIIDEPFSSLNANRVCELFGDEAKSIITLRDPRDIYVNALKYKYDFIPREINAFISWYENIMARFKSQSLSEKVYVIHFEDLIINNTATVEGIFNFLGIGAHLHSKKGHFLKPQESAKNVGVWKSYTDKHAMDLIQEKLEGLCWL